MPFIVFAAYTALPIVQVPGELYPPNTGAPTPPSLLMIKFPGPPPPE